MQLRRRLCTGTGLIIGLAISGALAYAPRTSVRPIMRDSAVLSVATSAVQARPVVAVYYNAKIRPIRRGTVLNGHDAQEAVNVDKVVQAAVLDDIVTVASTPPVFTSVRPKKRPKALKDQNSRVRTAAVVTKKPVKALFKPKLTPAGSVCGVAAIKGTDLPRIPGKLKGCGIDKPVSVTEIEGVKLSRPATMNCSAAKAIQTWVNDGIKPTIGRLGGGVDSLKVIADYSCRTRNNKPGAKISEHATGNAVDIAAFTLKNGVVIDVKDGWRDRTRGPLLKKLHKTACGPFGTVLGPESDAFHQDHFHLDVASYRAGPYCH